MTGCSHLKMISSIVPEAQDVCPECVALGDAWVHLRVCLTCGHVGCCDSSPNRHALRHYHATNHPLIQSMEPGETWRFCYADDVVLPDGAPLRY